MKKYGGVITNWQIHKLSISQEKIDEMYPDTGAKPMVFTGTAVKDLLSHPVRAAGIPERCRQTGMDEGWVQT